MKRKLAVLLACAMLITAAAPVESALAASGTTSTVKQQARTTVNKTVKTPQRGWYTLKNGQKRYFRNGKCLKGLQKIANRRYFFDVKTGVMKSNNVTYRRVLYYINEKSLYTLQYVIMQIIKQSEVIQKMTADAALISGSAQTVKATPTSESVKAAAIIFSTVPIILVYPFLQKYFVKGVTLGAVKD